MIRINKIESTWVIIGLLVNFPQDINELQDIPIKSGNSGEISGNLSGNYIADLGWTLGLARVLDNIRHNTGNEMSRTVPSL